MNSPFTLIIDWLAFTLPEVSVQETMSVLGGEWTKSKAGFRGYPLSWIWAEGSRGVGKLGTGAPRRPREVHVDLSAGIVSTWPLDQVRRVLQWVRVKQGHVTRIDCAFDDRVPLVPIAMILAAVKAGQCVTRAERLQTIESGLIHRAGKTGETLYFGSPQSQTLLRIYDKRLELQAKQREDAQDYGIRWELELKKDRANVCAACLVTLEESDWREFLVGVLRSYVDFRDTSPEADDEDRYRAPLVPWYAELTEQFQKSRLIVEKDEQTLPKVKRWVNDAVAPMLAVICASPNGQPWLEHAIVEAVARWKDKHRKLLKKPIQPSSDPHAGGDAGAPSPGGEGVSPDSPC